MPSTDPYTTPHRSTRKRARRELRQVTQDADLFANSLGIGPVGTRAEFLQRLAADVVEEEQKLVPLLAAFDLNACHSGDSTVPLGTSDSDLSSNSARSAHVLPNDHSICGDASLSRSCFLKAGYDGSTHKNLYLSTPVRMKYFPKLSPGTLGRLLTTPPIRISTPEQVCAWAEEGDSELCLRPAGVDQGPVLASSTPQRPRPAERSPLAEESAATARPCSRSLVGSPFGPSALPLTPPPTSQLPNLDTFPRLAIPHALSPPSVPAEHQPVVSSSKRRSADDVRSPLAADSGGYTRPAPRPLRTARSDLHALSQQRSLMNLTGALQQHALGGISSSALWNFRRVMDELRGAGSTEADDDSDGGDVDLASDAPTPGAPASQIRASIVPASQEDPDASNAGQRSFTSDYSGDGLRPRSSPVQLAPPCGPDVSTLSLQDEFVGLLLGQADEEETHALELMALAERLQTMAKQRRQLAHITAAKTL